MNDTESIPDEFSRRMCYLFWDMFNTPQLSALSPSTSHPTVVQYSSFILSVLTCIIGYAGNIIVIFITGFLRKTNKSHIWFLNLALADFIFLLLLPLNAVSVLKARWSYGVSMCKFYNFYTFVNMYASIYILTALNIDRALSVAKPIWHLKFLSRKFVYTICTLIWVLSAVCSIPAAIYSDVHYFSEEPQCLLFPDDLTNILYSSTDQNSSEFWSGEPRNVCDSVVNMGEFQDWTYILSTTMALVIPLAVIGCLIPLCVILFSNIIIAHHVKNSQQAASSRLYMVVIAAVLVFFCTRIPLLLAQIIYLVAAHNLELTLMYKVILFLPLLSSIAATNTFLNPVVYVLVGKQVRAEISQFWETMISEKSISI